MYYKLVSTNGLQDCEKKVNELIQEGYKPIGGVSVTVDPQYREGSDLRNFCVQALIKE